MSSTSLGASWLTAPELDRLVKRSTTTQGPYKSYRQCYTRRAGARLSWRTTTLWAIPWFMPIITRTLTMLRSWWRVSSLPSSWLTPRVITVIRLQVSEDKTYVSSFEEVRVPVGHNARARLWVANIRNWCLLGMCCQDANWSGEPPGRKLQDGASFWSFGCCQSSSSGTHSRIIQRFLVTFFYVFQVYGIDRLRVIDGSIIPKVTSGNTNAPIIMVAEKGSDIIKSRWITPQGGFFYTNRVNRQWGSW